MKEHSVSDDETPDATGTPGWEPATPPDEASGEASVPPATVTESPRRTRGLLAAGAAGLVIVGGLAGFGLGRTTADSDVPAVVPAGQQVPGQQGYGFDGTRPDRGGRPFGDGDGDRLPGDDRQAPDANQAPGDAT